MTTFVTRLFAAEDKAVAAVSALKRQFLASEINLVTPASGKNAADLEAAIVKGGVSPAAAAAYAAKVGKGNSLVTVAAAWGFANDAITALNRAGAIEGSEESSEPAAAASLNEAAPFSKWLGLPVLSEFKSYVVLKNDPAPYSRLAKWAVLSTKKSTIELLNDSTPFSKKINQPVLSKEKPKATLAASDKSLTVLMNSATPFSDLFNLQVLAKD